MLRIETWEVTCEGAPVQAEGTLSDGREFYFRSRHSQIWFGAGQSEVERVQHHGIGFRITGWDNDPHLVSVLDLDIARKLADVMCAILGYAETHAAGRPPYAHAWTEEKPDG